MPIDLQLKAEMDRVDSIYGGDEMYRILGPTSLSYTSTDSNREYMFTSHLKQVLTLIEPDVPRLQTSFENVVGEYNGAFKRMKGTWEVKAIIQKYPGLPSIYTMVLYNRASDMYEMIEKRPTEGLTEKFGYLYNTEVMDRLQVGDTITDKVLFRSTSYDKHMNYRYGKNANVMLSTSTNTLEDAIPVRRSWAEGVKSVEVDTITVSVNNNDVLLNLYGNNEEYKPFPNIGESVFNSILCATRKVNKDHIFYDFQEQNMRRLYNTDTEYYTSKQSIVDDIDVYYNGDDPFPEDLFHSQLKRYYDMECAYAESVYEWATRIKESDSKKTKNISRLRSKYANWTNPEYKWKNKDRVFGHIVIEFHVHSIVSLDPGSKLSGRYGDKGVIGEFIEDTVKMSIEEAIRQSFEDPSNEYATELAKQIKFVADDEMPYTDDGPVDILCNMSGSTRRKNPHQIMEIEVNFQARQVQLYIKNECKTKQEKLDMIFKFLHLVNPDEADFYKAFYQSFDKYIDVGPVRLQFISVEAQDEFIRDIEENGFYLIRPPHKPLLYHDIKAIYDAFPFIKPYPIYIDKFGVKKRRIMRDAVVGSKYIIVLKQNSNKNFSARSTYRVNRSNLPTKDIAKKTNRSAYARTAVRLSEIYNLLASVSGRDIAEWNIFTRSSAIGRKSLKRILAADGNPLEIKKLKIKDNFTNTNADILNARLKGIGLKLNFFNRDDKPDVYLNVASPMNINGYTIITTRDKYEMFYQLFQLFDREMREFVMLTTYPGEKEELCWKKVFELEEAKQYPITDEDKALLVASTRPISSTLTEVKNKTDENLDQMDPGSKPIRRRRRRKQETEETKDESN